MKKNRTYGLMENVCLLKMIKMMRFTIFILSLSLSQAFAVDSYSQQTKLSLDMKNARVEDVIDNIEKNSEFFFMYNKNMVDVDRKVDIKVKEKNVNEVLDKIFANTDVTYSIKDRQILLINSMMLGETKEMVSQKQKSVAGKVIDISGAPIPGVTVVIKGKTVGVITDISGNYSIGVPDKSVLQFSFVGMKMQEIQIGDKTVINVTLLEETIGIEEVVAVGYGTQKKLELTSAVSSVKSASFMKGSIKDAAQLIKGQVAGVSIINPDANPTGVSQILLRGVTTLASGTQPLIVIDGVPGGLNDVAPEDIETIDILKDGSAAAIYGTRGTNGVILITTKKVNKETPATIEWNSYVSTQIITKNLDFMNADDYRKLVSQKKPGAFDYGSNTNWIDEIFQTPVSHTHNVSMKGGSTNTNYIVNINYKALQGLMLKSDNNVLTTRIEANQTMFNGKVKINANIMGYDKKYFSGASGTSWRSDVYRYGLIYNPTDPVKDANGNWTEHLDNNYRNPVSLIQETLGLIQETNIKPFGTITISPITGLTFKVLGSRNIYSRIEGYAETFKNVQSILSARKGYASRTTSKSTEDLLEITGSYLGSIDKHNINLLGGYTYNAETNENFSANNYNFPSDLYTYDNLSLGSARTSGLAGMSSYRGASKLVSYFARANYNYGGKYLLNTSIRYEGSTKFGADNKWGAFPSVSAGWNIISEPFMKNYPSISALKIRGGYGVTGTSPSSSYRSLSRLSYGNKILYNGSWIPVINPASNNNPYLGWERKEETNIGFELGVFENRIFGNVDFYKRTTKNLLWDYNVATPPYLYSTIFANAGTMENKGIEVQITATPVQTSELTWSTTVNYSSNNNKLISLSSDQFQLKAGFFYTGSTGEPIQTTTHIVKEGEAIGNFWGYKSIDIDDNGRWIIEGADGNPKPISAQQPTDKKILGNGLPKHYLNWNNTVNYKKFDLNVSMSGAFGFQILNFTKMFFSVPVSLTRGNVMKSTYDNIYGKRPLADSQELQYVSYFIEDGDYWKIGNITLGYTLDFNNGPVKYVRFYASGRNMFTFTGYSGIDPEVNSTGLNPGNDERDRYPNAREYSFGISIKF